MLFQRATQERGPNYSEAVCVSEVLRDWIIENYPPGWMRELNDGKTSPAKYHKKMKLLLKQHKQTSRLSILWRRRMCQRTGLPESLVVLATNHILMLMEQALEQGETVMVLGTGDIHAVANAAGKKRLKFTIDPDWDMALNPPTKLSELGLKYKVSQSGRVSRRNLIVDESL